MRKFLIVFILPYLLSLATSAQSNVEMVIPAPKEYKSSEVRFNLSADFAVSLSGAPGSRVSGAAARMLQRLKNRTGLFINQNLITANYPLANMTITVERSAKNQLYEDESYHLVITPEKIVLSAVTDFGAMHGIETFLQLLQCENDNYFFPGCDINDAPRFPWRGLLIDVGRHFMPVGVIKRNIDGMAAVKMNVLHLHLTEDQGFRIECKAFPRLHQLGSGGEYFTQEQIKEIIAYADDRGIRVVPEFDMPGHSTSWFTGYPSLASGEGPYVLEPRYGVFVPTMNPAKETTYQFLDTFFREMTSLFPDEYIHIGGDENNGKEWDDNPSIQEFKLANNLPDNHSLQAYFNKRILDMITKYGKKMIGWDEIMEPGLPKTILIQSWRKDGLVTSVQNGFPVILSKGYYIDLMQPAEFHYRIDPLPDSLQLSEEQKKLVLGGEAAMWSEMVTEETIDSRIWPRTAAIAERLWSPASVTNVQTMYAKLDRLSIQLEELGLTHVKNCDMMLRRIAGRYDISALKTFVDVVEPVKFYHRVSSKEFRYTTRSPYGRVVDAARPDARVARYFNMLVDSFLVNRTNKKLADEVRYYLKMWSNNHEALDKLIQTIPELKEIETLSSDLAAMSRAGLTAMNYLKGNRRSPRGWRQKNLNQLKQDSKDKARAQVEIAVIKGIQELIENVR